MKIIHLSIVDTNNAANHFGDDDHITKVGFDDSGFFIRGSLFLCLAQFLNETHGAALETALEPAASTSMNELLRIALLITWNGLKICRTYFNELEN